MTIKHVGMLLAGPVKILITHHDNGDHQYYAANIEGIEEPVLTSHSIEGNFAEAARQAAKSSHPELFPKEPPKSVLAKIRSLFKGNYQ